jgi:hypothetical protein
VPDIVIPYGMENKLFYFILFLFYFYNRNSDTASGTIFRITIISKKQAETFLLFFSVKRQPKNVKK